MKCEMSAFNIPAVDYTVRVMFESYDLPHGRNFCPPLALAAPQSPFIVLQRQPPDCPMHNAVPPGQTLRNRDSGR